MTYKAKTAVLRSVQNTQRKASTMQNFWMLNLVVRKETARLWKFKQNARLLHGGRCVSWWGLDRSSSTFCRHASNLKAVYRLKKFQLIDSF